MTNPRIDTSGQALPPHELPSPEKLRVYGDMLFLAFRSSRHSRMSIATLRTYFEPPVELGQFRLFRFDDVPRGMYTWAFLSEEAERKILDGAPLTHADWQSGDRLWIMDIIAPYRGLTHSIGRWVMKRGNFTDGEFLFRRVAGENTTRRIVHVDFNANRLARVFTDKTYLKWRKAGGPV